MNYKHLITACKLFYSESIFSKLNIIIFVDFFLGMWLAALIFFLIFCLFSLLSTRKPKYFPPGPKWWPFLGSSPQLALALKRNCHMLNATTELAKKYGPVLGLKVGKEVIVVVHDYLPNKEFLHSDALAGRPYGEFFDMRTWGKRKGKYFNIPNITQENV